MKQKLILPLLLLSLLLSMGNLQKRREALADRIAGGTQFSFRLYPGPPAGKRRQQERGFRLAFQKQNQPGDCRQPFSCRKANAL